MVPRTRRSATGCRLLAGIVIAEAGMLLVSYGQLGGADSGSHFLNYVGGLLMLAGWISLLWQDGSLTTAGRREAAPSLWTVRFGGKLLGTIGLNGHHFAAYEAKTGSPHET